LDFAHQRVAEAPAFLERVRVLDEQRQRGGEWNVVRLKVESQRPSEKRDIESRFMKQADGTAERVCGEDHGQLVCDALYGDSGGEKGTPKDTSIGEHSQKAASSQVSEASILAVVTQNRRALNTCYDRVLKHDSSLKRARLVTHVKVGISGSVLNVSVPDPEYANSEIGVCLTQTIKHWHFPAADAEYETQFPIILQAE